MQSVQRQSARVIAGAQQQPVTRGESRQKLTVILRAGVKISGKRGCRA
jgi:hypothetical protein